MRSAPLIPVQSGLIDVLPSQTVRLTVWPPSPGFPPGPMKLEFLDQNGTVLSEQTVTLSPRAARFHRAFADHYDDDCYGRPANIALQREPGLADDPFGVLCRQRRGV